MIRTNPTRHVLAAPLAHRLVPIQSPALRTSVQLVAGIAFLALLAQVRLEIGPVPVTGQTLGVLLLGAAYGLRLGAVTTLAYLLVGGLGLPLFAGGGAGWSTLTGATGGYLVGFVLAAALVGALAERGWDRSYAATAAAMLLGSVAIYLPGLLWLRTLLPDWPTTLAAGLLPFLAGDALKLLLAVGLLPTAHALLGRR